MQHPGAVRWMGLVGLMMVLAGNLPAQPTLEDRVLRRFPSAGDKIPSLQAPAQLVSLSSPVRVQGTYTTRNWAAIIDSTWGPGLATDAKLGIFDTFWDRVNRYYGGFPNLTLNWDSIKTLYRPQVEAGVSRGKFAAIMSRLWMSLMEAHHTYVLDIEVDTSSIEDGNINFALGMPMLFAGGWGYTGFGAALTPLPDGSLLVYRAISSHPLGLVPGDIVLGYDRVPWTRTFADLSEAGLPYNVNFAWWGDDQYSQTYAALNGVGMHWSLFDTIDIAKYATHDTLHLSTQPMRAFKGDTLWCGDQLPVPGIPTPNYLTRNSWTSWGVISGTTIGYVCVQRWSNTSSEFATALDELINSKKVSGLIIDFRFNIGGSPEQANAGFANLFTVDPTDNYRIALRSNQSDHFGFTLSAARAQEKFTPGIKLFDRPIAVLTGPGCWSAGDYNAFRMRFHPMVRFFGKRTSTAYVGSSTSSLMLADNAWYFTIRRAGVFSDYSNEGHLLHKGFNVDEEVWLTRDGVAKGEDAVVQRALEWIEGASYAHDLTTDHLTAQCGKDTVGLRVIWESPSHHVPALWAIVTDRTGVQVDSCQMLDDGMHRDSTAGDNVFGGLLCAPSVEDLFHISLKTQDLTDGSSRILRNVGHIATLGPVAFSRIVYDPADSIPQPADLIRLKVALKNLGTTGSAPAVTARLTCLDSSAQVPDTLLTFGTIAPATEVLCPVIVPVTFSASRPGDYDSQFLLTIMVDQVPLWSKPIAIHVYTGVADGNEVLPLEFSLFQNYPNPFNPATTIRYALPHAAHVVIRVCNTLGQEVAQLMNDDMDAGFHEVPFDASHLSSGVYLYQIRAGDVVSVKKMMLVK
jgi:hypothetical protein